MRMTRATLAAAICALAPLSATAEGARLVLQCDFVTACSQSGDCGPGKGPAGFVLEPADVDPGGKGSYTLRLDDGDAAIPTEGLSQVGPFVWSMGEGTRTTLVLTGEASAILVRQITDTGTNAPPSAEIDIMNCEITL